jgi:hypothetical protein
MGHSRMLFVRCPRRRRRSVVLENPAALASIARPSATAAEIGRQTQCCNATRAKQHDLRLCGLAGRNRSSAASERHATGRYGNCAGERRATARARGRLRFRATRRRTQGDGGQCGEPPTAANRGACDQPAAGQREGPRRRRRTQRRPARRRRVQRHERFGERFLSLTFAGVVKPQALEVGLVLASEAFDHLVGA